MLAVYLLVLVSYGFISGNYPSIREVGYSFFLTQLILVAIPEEVFFRGYLQKQFGNDYRAKSY